MPSKRHSGGSQPLSISQNFITSIKVIERLLARTSLGSTDHVVEIGPGKGHITAALLQRCRLVTAVELDAKLYQTLSAKLISFTNLQLHLGDFLQWDLPKTGNYKVFSNIPFSRTTAIVRKLTECVNPPEEAWLVMEKGAARRFMGNPRETLRSLVLRPWFDLKIIYHFERQDFHPSPRVDAVLLRITRKTTPDLPQTSRMQFEGFVSTSFNRGKPCAANGMREAGVTPNTSPGDILYVQWLCLFRQWLDELHHRTISNGNRKYNSTAKATAKERGQASSGFLKCSRSSRNITTL